MIKTYQRPLWESEQLHDCATCGRKAGNICRTNKGLATKEPHSARCKAWYEAGVSSGFIKHAYPVNAHKR